VGHLVATLGLIFIFRIALDFVDGFTAQAGHQKIVPKSGD
jgi:phosphatidylglycerophosphate synthase